MQAFYEVIKWFFFFATIFVGIIFLRWEIFWGVEKYDMIKSLIIPGYLVFCGIIIGYIIAHMLNPRADEVNKTYVVSFIIGISLGIILAITYIFV